MRSFLTAALALTALPVPAPAQSHVLFEEAFESGIPATWTHIRRAWAGDPWAPGFQLVDGSGDINMEWWCTNGFTMRDHILLSPPIDLSSVARAYFECGQWQIFPAQRWYNAIVVSTDGGATVTPVYQENGMWSGFGSIKADISAFAGKTNVQVGVHYRGTIGNDWSIDNVRVTANPVRHVVTPLVQGQPASFGVAAATPGNSVFMLLSGTGSGPLPTPWGNLNLFPPIVSFPGLVVDAAGNASANVTVPPGTQGLILYSQAIEVGAPATINVTNSLALTIQ